MSPIEPFKRVEWATEEMVIRRSGMRLEKVGELSWFGSSDLGLVKSASRRAAEPGEVLMGRMASDPGDVVDTITWTPITLEQVNELVARAVEIADEAKIGQPVEDSEGRFEAAVAPFRP